MSITASEKQLLQDTHDTVTKIDAMLAERCPACVADVKKLTRFVEGNGDRGAKLRLDRLERELKMTRRAKVVWTTTGGTAGCVLTMLGKFVLGVFQQ